MRVERGRGMPPRAGIYVGPIEFFQRYMARRPVTHTDFVTDPSDFTVELITMWDVELLAELMTGPARRNGIGVPCRA